jgi:hypothetical protein
VVAADLRQEKTDMAVIVFQITLTDASSFDAAEHGRDRV